MMLMKACHAQRFVLFMQNQGFSLVECLIILAIVAILSVFAMSSYRFFINKTQDEVMSSELMRAIDLARSEAVSRSEMVTLCQSKDQQKCGISWEEGYIITSNEKVLFTFPTHIDGVLQWRGFPRWKNFLQFLPNGLPDSENGTFLYCAKGEKTPRWGIVINLSGRARLVSPDANGDIINDEGKVLTC